jgi:cold shock CspA family protein
MNSYTGSVLRFGNRGFGWIMPNSPLDSRTAIYVHVNFVVGKKILMAGDEVSFDLQDAPRGPQAVNVTLLAGGGQ